MAEGDKFGTMGVVFELLLKVWNIQRKLSKMNKVVTLSAVTLLK